MPRVAQLRMDGPFPEDDGWAGVYRGFAVLCPAGTTRREFVCRYFRPRSAERWRDQWIFRALGVHLFGAIVPTGGIVVRRLTGAKMHAYTLSRPSIEGARRFYYRACIFETLHAPFLITLVVLALRRLAEGRSDLALENTLVNLAANVFPILHHRRTRTRIFELLEREARRSRRRREAS